MVCIKKEVSTSTIFYGKKRLPASAGCRPLLFMDTVSANRHLLSD